MFQALYEYFLSIFYMNDYFFMDDISFEIGGGTNNVPYEITFGDWLCSTLAIISLIIIIVLCCLFIYRLIRLVGRLFSGGAL